MCIRQGCCLVVFSKWVVVAGGAARQLHPGSLKLVWQALPWLALSAWSASILVLLFVLRLHVITCMHNQYGYDAHLEMPKSAILALPCLSSSTFCGFRSLCTTAGCRYASPEAMSNPTCRICGRKHDRHTAAAWQHDVLCMQSSLQTATSPSCCDNSYRA